MEEIIREIYENEGEEGVRNFIEHTDEFYDIWEEEFDQ